MLLGWLKIINISAQRTNLPSSFMVIGFNGIAVEPRFERMEASLSMEFLWCQKLAKLGNLLLASSIIEHGRHTSLGVNLGASTPGVSPWDESSSSWSWVWTRVWLLTLSRVRFMPFPFCFSDCWPLTLWLGPLYKGSPMLHSYIDIAPIVPDM